MTPAELTPEVLARMEAKLLADVEVLRKMRALLEAHGTTLGAMIPAALVPATAAVPPPAGIATPTPVTPVAPAAPVEPLSRKSLAEHQQEALATFGGQTFVMEELRRVIHKRSHHYPDTAAMKTFVNRLMREGKVTVAERRTGRIGNLYRCLLPAPAAEAPPTQG